jgi:hypothetical protein
MPDGTFSFDFPNIFAWNVPGLLYFFPASVAHLYDNLAATTDVVTKRLREAWDALDAEGKKPFEALAIEDKQRSDRDNEAWQKRQSLSALEVATNAPTVDEAADQAMPEITSTPVAAMD